MDEEGELMFRGTKKVKEKNLDGSDSTSYKNVTVNDKQVLGSFAVDLGFENYGELYDKAIELKEGGSEFDPLKF